MVDKAGEQTTRLFRGTVFSLLLMVGLRGLYPCNEGIQTSAGCPCHVWLQAKPYKAFQTIISGVSQTVTRAYGGREGSQKSESRNL